MDNTLSRFAPKLVSLYVASFKRDEWDKYIDELSGQDIVVANFTAKLAAVDGNIGTMLKSLDQMRRHNTHDWYVLDANHSYVQLWSIIQCTVVIMSSLVQVYFVRKLFLDSESNAKGGKFKPRA